MALTNKQYDELMRVYEKRQLHARHLQEQKKTAIYEAIPELTGIDEAIAGCSVRQAHLLLDTDSAAATAEEINILKKNCEELRAKRISLLAAKGYQLSDLEPVYTCPDCKDTGYIGSKRCHCFVQAALDLVYAQSNLSSILSEENFSHFREDYYSDSLVEPASGMSAKALIRQAYEVSQSFVNNFDTTFMSILFYGATGVGKTFLSNCIAKELLDSGHSVIYFSATQLFDLLEKCKFDHSQESMAYQQDLYTCDLLIIDDLGTELSNSFTVSQLFQCLNERILRKKSTIISTNLGIDQLFDLYSERIFSRIASNYTLLKLHGDDIRLQKKRAQ